VDWASRSVGHTYFPDGALQTATNPDGSVATYAYDNTRRLTDILHEQGVTTIGHYAYTLDPVGNVTGLQDGAQASTYGLDRLYRLTTVSGPDGSRTYGYDPGGKPQLGRGGRDNDLCIRPGRPSALPAGPANARIFDSTTVVQ